MADGGIEAVTRGEGTKLPPKGPEKVDVQMPLASRPSLVTLQSSSMPSTPYIHAQNLSDDCRTPSPIIKPEVTSPRSARSESDGTIRSQGRLPYLSGCKYETAMTYSRRRIPYAVGGDILEHGPETPKKMLSADEENRLTADIKLLYSTILPSAESDTRRARLIQKLERILNDQWPGNDIQVHVFGSTGNLLCTSDSDGQSLRRFWASSHSQSIFASQRR